MIEPEYTAIETISYLFDEMIPLADDHALGVFGNALELAAFAEHDEAHKRFLGQAERILERFNVILVLFDGVIEALFRFFVEAHGPVALISTAEYPARVILAFEYVDAALVEHEDIDLGGVRCALTRNQEVAVQLLFFIVEAVVESVVDEVLARVAKTQVLTLKKHASCAKQRLLAFENVKQAHGKPPIIDT